MKYASGETPAIGDVVRFRDALGCESDEEVFGIIGGVLLRTRRLASVGVGSACDTMPEDLVLVRRAPTREEIAEAGGVSLDAVPVMTIPEETAAALWRGTVEQLMREIDRSAHATGSGPTAPPVKVPFLYPQPFVPSHLCGAECATCEPTPARPVDLFNLKPGDAPEIVYRRKTYASFTPIDPQAVRVAKGASTDA